MTNPDNVGGLPELPEPAAFMKRPSAQNSYNREEPYFTASQMRAYGELCRAAPAGGDDLYRQACDSVEEWKARALEAEADIARIHAQINAENGPTFMGEPVVSAPAGSGEVTDEMVEAGWQSFVRAGVDKRTQNAYVSKTDLRAALEAALLRKLQQGADYVMVPRVATEAMMSAWFNSGAKDGRTLKIDDDIRAAAQQDWTAMIAASQGQEGGK